MCVCERERELERERLNGEEVNLTLSKENPRLGLRKVTEMLAGSPKRNLAKHTYTVPTLNDAFFQELNMNKKNKNNHLPSYTVYIRFLRKQPDT